MKKETRQKKQTGLGRQDRMPISVMLVLSSAMLVACSDSGVGNDGSGVVESNESQVLDDDTVLFESSAEVPADLLQDKLQDGMAAKLSERCVAIDEPFSLSVTYSESDNDSVEPDVQNITGYVTINQDNGDSIEVLSRSDDGIELSLPEQDVVVLTASLDGKSTTTYAAAFDEETPETVILRKAIENGCAYAFRVPGFCATGASYNGLLVYSINGVKMTANGCSLSHDASIIPVIDIIDD